MRACLTQNFVVQLSKVHGVYTLYASPDCDDDGPNVRYGVLEYSYNAHSRCCAVMSPVH